MIYWKGLVMDWEMVKVLPNLQEARSLIFKIHIPQLVTLARMRI